MRYALIGHGRMGRAIERAAGRRGHVKVAELGSAEGALLAAGTIGPSDVGGAEVAFEFTTPASGRDNVLGLTSGGIPVVCGTTGWELDRSFREAIDGAQAGAVVAPNFSLGMQLFERIVAAASRLVAAADSHRSSVSEAHHTGKRDAPSGSARELARILRETDPRIRSVQEGNPDGPLASGALQVVSLRVDSEPGTHSVAFDGVHDRIELTHRARGRDGFASGAVLAGEWILGRSGLHAFEEVIESLLEGSA